MPPRTAPATLIRAGLVRIAFRIRRGVGRTRGFLATVMIITVVVTAVVLRPARDRPGGDPTVGQVVRVGVADGDSIPEYAASSAAELADAVAADSATPRQGGLFALVTLVDYGRPGELVGLVAGVEVVEVFVRVPLPAVQTEIVRLAAGRIPDDLVAGMSRWAERKQAEVGSYASRAAGATDRATRDYLDARGRVSEREAAALREPCACVYALVVRATPVALAEVSGRAGVRIVDPAPEVRRFEHTVFNPPIPEQKDRVRPPEDSGLMAISPKPS